MARTPVSAIVDGKRVIVKKPELLAPAGSLEKLKIAVMYGADAVFIGGREFGLRSNAQNFSLEEINMVQKSILPRILLLITRIWWDLKTI